MNAPSSARCPNTSTWVGSGAQRHSSGHNPTFRCALQAGHEGRCIMERQPAGPREVVALPPVPAPPPLEVVVVRANGFIETEDDFGLPYTFISGAQRARLIRGRVTSRRKP